MTMRSSLLAALLLAAACGGSPAPKPAPTSATAAPAEPAPAAPTQREIRDAARASEEAVTLELRVERDRVDVDIVGIRQSIPNVGGAVDGHALAAAIDGIDFDGGAIVYLADDATYELAVAAMDLAKQEGIADIGIETPADPSDDAVEAPPPTTGAATPPEAVKVAPILIISTTDVTLRLPDGAPQTAIAIGKVADLLAHPGPEIPALRTAVGAMSPHPTLLILQAEPSTTGSLFNRSFRTLKRMGVDNVLLAIKTNSSASAPR
jgi:hypothetical protein